MASPRLIATDLDETLLDESGRIPDENVSALREAISRGIAVTICTGRMYSSAKSFADEIGINAPLICYNGALIRDPATGEVISHRPLEMGLARELLAFFRERGTYVQSYIDDVLYARDAEELEFLNYERYFGIVGRAVGDALYTPTVAPTKLLAMTDTEEESQEVMALVRERFGELLYVARSNSNFVEMIDKSVNKGRSLAFVADRLGVPMSEVMAIGDGENDAEMIGMAGFGFAVANAARKAKEAAREITPSNSDAGVAWAVRKYAIA